MPVRGRGRFQREDDATFIDPGSARIREYRALKRQRNASQALELLRRVGSTVRPIMVKYGFNLPLLTEFLPRNPNLLGINVNRGQRISLRLRWDSSPEQLIDEEQVTLVMLHELTHNVVGPHNEQFYAFLDKLTEEYYQAKRDGRWEGEGFMRPGHRLGGGDHGSAQVSQSRLGTAPSRLGGTSTESSKTPRQLAAEAAERRRNDSHVCPSTQEEIQIIAAEAEEQERINGIQVITIQDDQLDDEDGDDIVFTGVRTPGSKRKVNLGDFTDPSPSPRRPEKRKRTPAKAEIETIVLSSGSDTDTGSPSRRAQPPPPPALHSQLSSRSRLQTRAAAALRYHNDTAAPISRARTWICQACTFANSSATLACEICHTSRPGSSHSQPVTNNTSAASTPIQSGWQCSACGFRMVDGAAAFWMCSQCGAIRSSSRSGESGSGVMLGGGGF